MFTQLIGSADLSLRPTAANAKLALFGKVSQWPYFCWLQFGGRQFDGR
jgi:hypothetical protein